MEETDVSSNMKLGLDLELGLTKYKPAKMDNSKKNKRVFFLDLSIPLHRSTDLDDHHAAYSSSSCIGFMQEDKKQTKKKSNFCGSKDDDDDDMNYSKNCSRKKLRLSKDQITLLEDSFGQHSTLTMAQKQALAEKLNLKPRQVEVWFQNRRARTKLKQTEIDYEALKKKFERLSDENRCLRNQLLELRSLPPTSAAATKGGPVPRLAGYMPRAPLMTMFSLGPPLTATAPSLQQLFYQMPKESACSSCERILKTDGGKKQKAAVVDAITEVIDED